jgi:hypothetical protein
MERFDKEEGQRKKEEENLMEADDEGWVTVTKSTKKKVPAKPSCCNFSGLSPLFSPEVSEADI